MNRHTREVFNAMLDAMAASYGVQNPREQFAADIPMAIKLNEAIQASSEFLKQITILPVQDIKGQIVRIVIPSTIAGRTDTSGGGSRAGQTIGSLDGRTYECKQTDYDVAILYATLDAWARFPNFRQLYMSAVYQRMALDRIMIGWYGQSAAATTDRATNTKLQDVNKGWLYDLKTNNSSHFLTAGDVTAGKITIGPTGDYKTLDQFVYDVGSVIDDEHRTGNEVAIIGRELVSYDMNKTLAAMGQTPTEKAHFQTLAKSYGGYPSVMVPSFPTKGVFVGDPKRLHIYFQDSAVRRQSKDEPEKNRIVDYINSSDSYIIEDLEAVAGAESANVVLQE